MRASSVNPRRSASDADPPTRDPEVQLNGLSDAEWPCARRATHAAPTPGLRALVRSLMRCCRHAIVPAAATAMLPCAVALAQTIAFAGPRPPELAWRRSHLEVPRLTERQRPTGGSSAPETPFRADSVRIPPGIHAVASVRPLLRAWNVTLWRRCPICSSYDVRDHSDLLPLKSAPAGLSPHVSSVLTSGPSAWGIVRVDSGTALSDDGVPRAHLRFSSFRTAGDYTGDLALAPGTDSGTVKLTVRVQDGWWWAVAMLVLGLLTAILAESFVSVGRPVMQILARLATLAGDLIKSDAAFANRCKAISTPLADGATAPPCAYSISKDVGSQRTAISSAARGFLQSPLTPLATKNVVYTALLDQLAELEATVAAWESFADDLATLHRAVAAADAALEVHPPPAHQRGTAPWPKEPALFSAAQRLLVGAPLAVADVKKRREDVRAYAQALPTWLEWDTRKNEYVHLISLLTRHATDPQKTELAALTESLRAVSAELWTATSPAALQHAGVASALDDADARLAKLRVVLPTDTRIAALSRLDLLGAGNRLWKTDMSLTADDLAGATTASTAATEVRRLRWLVVEGDLTVFVLAILIAVTAGLNVIYFGKAFGRGQDYLNAFVIGFGTRAGLDLLSSAARLFNRRLTPDPDAA